MSEEKIHDPDGFIFCVSGRKNILIAVDDSDSSERAVLYAAVFLKSMPEVFITIFNILPLPDEDFFASAEQRDEWLALERKKAEDLLAEYRSVLLNSGIPEELVAIKLLVKKNPSIAGAIIAEQRELGYCTVVVGRRHLTRQEEFLFGSTTSELLHNMPPDVCLWIIE